MKEYVNLWVISKMTSETFVNFYFVEVQHFFTRPMTGQKWLCQEFYKYAAPVKNIDGDHVIRSLNSI